MLAYSNSKLTDKKKLSGELNKLQTPLNACQKKIYHLQQAKKKSPGLDKLVVLYQKLTQLVEIKRDQLDLEKNDLEALRKSILAQGLRIYFNELKRKLHDPNARHVRLKVLNAAAAERGRQQVTKQSTKVSPLGSASEYHEKKPSSGASHKQENKPQDDATNITIEDIEAMLESLQQQLGSMWALFVSENNSQSSIFYQAHTPPHQSSTSPRQKVRPKSTDRSLLFTENKVVEISGGSTDSLCLDK